MLRLCFNQSNRLMGPQMVVYQVYESKIYHHLWCETGQNVSLMSQTVKVDIFFFDLALELVIPQENGAERRKDPRNKTF